MSMLPTDSPVSSGLSLAMLLGDILRGSDERNRANAAEQAASADYAELYRALTARMGQTDPLMQMLLQRLTEAGDPIGELDEEAIRNREAQRFSALAPAVDRANALAASQGFAQSMRSGMGDSTQAADQAGRLTREFSDVYAKLQENARTTAFSEALERLKAMLSNNQGNAQQLQMAMNGISNFSRDAQAIAQNRAKAASEARTSASAAWQEALMRALDSGIGKRLLNKADEKIGGWMDERGWGGAKAVQEEPGRFDLFPSPAPAGGNSGVRADAGGFGVRPNAAGSGIQFNQPTAPSWPTGGQGTGINPSFNLGTGSSNLMSGWNSPSSGREVLNSYDKINSSWSSGGSGFGSATTNDNTWGDGEDWWM